MAKIAFAGDTHGNLSAMYREVDSAETAIGSPIDAIIEVGDFHAIRHQQDLDRFPAKACHKELGDFPQYYLDGGVPRPTFFIGGNHENYHWLGHHPEGLQVVNNLTYLGRSGVRTIQDLRVGWVSGNYSPVGYLGSKKKQDPAHFTVQDTDRLLSHPRPIDILVFHDWPSIRSLEDHIETDTVSDASVLSTSLKRNLGSDPLFEVMKTLKPRYVVCGHVHQYLSFDAHIDGSRITFVALDKVGKKDSVCVLDTTTLEIPYRNSQTDILGILNHRDREHAVAGISLLQSNVFSEAQRHFETLCSSTSPPARGFGHYGLGTLIVKQNHDNPSSGDRTPSIESAVTHLRESLRLVEHADAHLMLGEALVDKSYHLFTHTPSSQASDQELIRLNREAVLAFENACRLNPTYAGTLQPRIERIRREQEGLLQRIASRG